MDYRQIRLRGGTLHEKISRKFHKLLPHVNKANGDSKNRVMFYFFKNVHIPILIPLYVKLKQSHPEVEICFGYKSYAPKIRAGFSTEELKVLRSYGEKMYINPSHAEARVTFVADAVYDWVFGCGKIVNVGHGILSKGQYYLDTELARREERADLVCVPGQYHKEALQGVITTPVMVTGMAKLDNLFNGSISRSDVEKSIGLQGSNRKYILFAPTFNEELSAIPFVKEDIADIIPEENFSLIIKLHGSTKNEYVVMYEELAKRDDRIILVRDLDLTPLIILADIMISDVSSAIMEFASKDKPLVLFNSPRQKTYQNYNENSIEYKFRDLGIEVNDLNGIKEAVERSILNPLEFSSKRIEYTNLLIANKSKADACANIIEESLQRFL
ncbi:CDP-glycerol glycerophosphotransferase family protein [Colwellia sp. PAMC 21821]|uniref:CDP-glycerol glycerophosphotransferase family protein n=1 Tax=Colwellia sp. PAMC 21821 TaxID=1816219 RepID=UPI0009C156B8|nr:CDP-glycerol glycerophosphotransferase family protein [Colwellia sp. PAMC 21821]ARD44558.1 hypothetical protein A3Q33_09700 [Colwellia sp. PAMC 21821]